MLTTHYSNLKSQFAILNESRNFREFRNNMNQHFNIWTWLFFADEFWTYQTENNDTRLYLINTSRAISFHCLPSTFRYYIEFSLKNTTMYFICTFAWNYLLIGRWQNFEKKIVKISPHPGLEPGSPGWKPNILTT